MHLSNKLLAEFLGTAMLLATVVGSGIMAENLADGNMAIALLGNTIPTGAILFVIITMFGPISGAHFNPAVTIAFALRKDFNVKEVLPYIVVQIVAGIIGVWAANFMFDLEVLQFSQKIRSSQGQWFSEGVATFGLLIAIFFTLKSKAEAVPAVVGMYITAAYWFTASTSFANPAVTIARQFSNTFAGIAPSSVPAFIVAQVIGMAVALLVLKRFNKLDF
ncbi:MAG: aquaporin family protein [Rhizobiales bacterium]|nr:aquaporin family protein [Hyphomicrobiales bacterium]